MLNVGDQIRTGFRSRATVRLSDLTVMKMNQLTTLQIQPPRGSNEKPIIDLKVGGTYFLRRDAPSETEFRTPQTSGGVLGTEFVLVVTEDGRTEITMLDGTVRLFNDRGELEVTRGEQGTVRQGQAPTKAPVLDAVRIVQWSLYYPAVLDPGELALTGGEQQLLAGSLAAYRAGDLKAALAHYPEGRAPASDAERVYLAGLVLAVGQAGEAEALLQPLAANSEPVGRLARALRRMIATVKGQEEISDLKPPIASPLATEHLVESYVQQARFRLDAARAAARAATAPSPDFGFAWARVAELEFSFGRAGVAQAALDRALELSPRNAQALALHGFTLAAQNRDAGMVDVSAQEASEAVRNDYANFSAHLFLANSFHALRDPAFGSLRYETAAFSEYLLANLLSPVGGTPLSPLVSQQEYSRLFERDRLGFASETTHLSSGQWQQSATQHGVQDSFANALEGAYQWLPGDAANTDLDQRALSLQLKQQLTPNDSVYFQAVDNRVKFGDTSQRYDPSTASPTLRNRDRQEPNIFAGWHHQWSPGSRTLLLLSALRDDFNSSDPQGRVSALLTDPTGATAGRLDPGTQDTFSVDYGSRFRAFGAELQHIWSTPKHTLIGGGRVQSGEVDTSSTLQYRGDPLSGFFYQADLGPNGEITGVVRQEVDSNLNRQSVYGYWQWSVVDSLSLVTGVSFDDITFPANAVAPPLTAAERSSDRVSPKAGLTWRPHSSSRFRAAYSQSLGGLFYDNSVRLEPVQIAGFNQAYRSLAPESVAGLIPGTRFETLDVGSEHRLPTRTYLGWQAVKLRSRAWNSIGVFSGTGALFSLTPTQVDQRVLYEERSLSFYVNQLVAEEWSFGLRYRISESEYDLQTPGISGVVWSEGTSHRQALLQEASLFGNFFHSSGVFASVEGRWTSQDNQKDDASLADENLWQFNCFVGYRWPRRQAEIAVGLLNITDANYYLNPVNAFSRLPRERTFLTRLRLNF